MIKNLFFALLAMVSTTKTMAAKCPDGFIKATNFCVMKYDAKCTNPDPKCVTSEGVYKNNQKGCECEGDFNIISNAKGAPITFIPEDDGSNTSAKKYCERNNWHLITNSEWMAIANDVYKVKDNWSGNFLANGHNDSSPNMALEASDDQNECYKTAVDGSSDCNKKGAQKRTLKLGNGEVIWDFAGNVWQWVDIKIARKDEPRTKIPGYGNLRWTWGEFQTVNPSSDYSPPDPNLNSKNGVGRIYHFNSLNDTDMTNYTFIRGGNWRHGMDSGAFTVHMQPVPEKTNIDDIGFRCAVTIDE